MNTDDIIRKFIKAAIKHGEATETGKYRQTNKQYDILVKCYNDLKSFGENGMIELTKLLEHPNDYVRLWAARYTLIVEPEKSKQTLLELTKRSGFLGFDAKMILSEWEKGNLKF